MLPPPLPPPNKSEARISEQIREKIALHCEPKFDSIQAQGVDTNKPTANVCSTNPNKQNKKPALLLIDLTQERSPRQSVA